MSCWWTLFGKKSSSDRSLMVHWPVPGVIRTRAIASLRRPVPSALPVTTGRRAAGRPSASGDVSVVYSETCASASSPGFASTSSAIVCVDSATVLSSCFLIGSHQRATLGRLATATSPGAGGWPRLLRDLLDREWDRLLRLMRMIRARVYLEFAEHAPAQRILGQHA